VGSIGNIPLAYEFRGATLRAATAYAWVVDESYRAYSVMILNRFIRQRDVDLFIFSTVSDKAERVYSNGLQFSRVPVGTWDKSSFWITEYQGFCESILTRVPLPFRRAIAYPMGLGLRVSDALKSPSVPPCFKPYKIESCTAF